MRHKHCLTWNMGRKLTNEENEKLWRQILKNVRKEKHTLQELEYGEKQRKKCKMKNTHSRILDFGKKTDK